MHWLTILTALIYSSILAILVIVRGWELTEAAALVFGLAFAVVLAIVVVISRMPKEEGKSFWQGFWASVRADLNGLMDLIRFK
ncbi:MAG: hypothetical protein WCT35_09715 [Sideroxydans sp.]|jgi:RsiW-degrading membrane proteinase PrsW (M82 family)